MTNFLCFRSRAITVPLVSALLLSMAQAAPAAEVPEVACRYEVSVTNQADHSRVTSHWLFWRTAEMIQTADGERRQGEIWERNAQNQIFYRKLYHADRTALEYMPSDSVMEQRDFDWARLSSLLDQKTLERLPRKSAAKFDGRPAEKRSGSVDGWEMEVIWLQEERLPASLKKSDGRHSIEMTLLDIKPLANASIPPVPVAAINRYRQIDHADLGDMESDPFVKKLDELEHHAHGH